MAEPSNTETPAAFPDCPHCGSNVETLSHRPAPGVAFVGAKGFHFSPGHIVTLHPCGHQVEGAHLANELVAGWKP